MPASALDHPTTAALLAYGQGRLSAAEMADIESHLGNCSSCCEVLASAPDDTLVVRAREAATNGFRAEQPTTPATKGNVREIPQPLRDHPRYRVLGLLGAGGMGAVYKAEHRLMERMVALKVINPTLVSSPAALERFEREVKAAAKLSHANIVTAHDAEQAGNLHFLVMEFVEGVSLDRWLAKTGPLPPQQAANLIRQAAQGLQHAHEKGMIHRDIKPHNLMVTRGGVLKILDFGLARLASQAWQSTADGDTADRPADATRAGAVLGTPDYIAPEQAVDAHVADIRADIYSLGCTLYFLLTGEPPFAGGTTLDKLRAHKSLVPTPIRLRRPDVPEELAAILDKMLAKDPAGRYSTPQEVAEALKPLARSRSLAAAPVVARPPSVPAPTVAADDAPAASLAGENQVPDLKLPELDRLPALQPAGSSPRAKKPGPRSTDQVSPLLWIAAGGTSVAVLVALAWVVLWGPQFRRREVVDRPQQTSPEQSDKSQPLIDPPADQVKPAVLAQTGSPRRLLLVLPQNYLWYPDYTYVRDAIPRGVQLTTINLSGQPSGLAQDSPPGRVQPDRELSDQVRARDFDGVIFVGYSLTELAALDRSGQPTEGRRQTARLLHEFNSAGKPIAALCAGQHILAAHGLLQPGVTVAGGQYAESHAEFANSGARRVGQGVVVSGNLITGSTATDGPELVRKVMDKIRGG
jgi:serine/threonine protein kinase/putative intracellular protease/amidase